MSGGSQLELVFTSWPDEDLLVAEIWSGDTYLADVVQRPEGLLMTMRSAGPLAASFRVEELEQSLEAVRRRFGLSAAPDSA